MNEQSQKQFHNLQEVSTFLSSIKEEQGYLTQFSFNALNVTGDLFYCVALSLAIMSLFLTAVYSNIQILLVGLFCSLLAYIIYYFCVKVSLKLTK